MSETLNQFILLSQKIIPLFNKYKDEKISEKELITSIQNLEPLVKELYLKSTDEEHDIKCQDIYASIHDMVLYYSKAGLANWKKDDRDWLMNNAIDRFNEIFETIQINK